MWLSTADCRMPLNFIVMNAMFFTFLQFAHRSSFSFAKFSHFPLVYSLKQWINHIQHTEIIQFSVNILCLSIFICLVVVLVSGKLYYFDRIALQATGAQIQIKRNRFQRESESNENNCWKIIHNQFLFSVKWQHCLLYRAEWGPPLWGYLARNGQCKQNCAKWKKERRWEKEKKKLKKWKKKKTQNQPKFEKCRLPSIWYFIFCMLFIISLIKM